MQFIRFIQRRGEEDVFAYVPKTEHASVDRFGRLTGLADLPATRHLEASPYVTGRGEYTHPGTGDPFHDGSDYFTTGGADLRLGVGGNLALDATINPDFGQVEVDPAIVNLSAFETFFDEKRPFFLEGVEPVLVRAGQRLEHGRLSPGLQLAPHRPAAPADLDGRRPGLQPTRLREPHPGRGEADRQDGRAAGRSALLDAVTREETAGLWTRSARSYTVPVEPLSNYFVGRVRHESADGNAPSAAWSPRWIAGSTTPTLAAMLRSSAYLGGVDSTITGATSAGRSTRS